jgi:Flp pilus assembly protein TadG
VKTIGSERGAAAVEFALVSILLLVIVFGIIEFGFLWLQSFYIANAAREGSRVAATLPDPVTADLTQVENTVKKYLKGLYPDALVDNAGGCCGNGDFVEVIVSNGAPIQVPGPPVLEVDTIKVSVTVQTSRIWQPVLWDLLKLINPSVRDDLNEISEFAVFAKEN